MSEQKLRHRGNHEKSEFTGKARRSREFRYRVTCLLTACQGRLPGPNAFSEDWKGNGDTEEAQVVQNWAVPATLVCKNVGL